MYKMIMTGALVALMGCEPEPAPTGDDVDIEGAVYSLRVGSLTIDGADDGLSDVVQLAFTQEVLVRTTNVTADALTMELAFGYKNTDPIERNPCFATTVLPEAVRTGAEIAIPATDLQFDTVSIGNFSLRGDLSEDGESIGDVVMTGLIDARDLANADFGDENVLCDTIGGFGLPCGACPDGAAFCVDMTIRGLGNQREEGVLFDDDVPDAGECDET